MKTNAVRLLDSLRISYELREYQIDPEALDAETVARKIGLPPEQVFKTLVVHGDRNGVCLAVIPANTELDQKALARLTGDRKAEMVRFVKYNRLPATSVAESRHWPASMTILFWSMKPPNCTM